MGWLHRSEQVTPSWLHRSALIPSVRVRHWLTDFVFKVLWHRCVHRTWVRHLFELVLLAWFSIGLIRITPVWLAWENRLDASERQVTSVSLSCFGRLSAVSGRLSWRWNGLPCLRAIGHLSTLSLPWLPLFFRQQSGGVRDSVMCSEAWPVIDPEGDG